MKGQAMRLATMCCEMRRWQRAIAAAFLLLAAGRALAADPEAASPAAKPYVASCPRAATFLTVVDVGHTAGAPGAMSARGVYEYDFNLTLARRIDADLRAAGFVRTVLMVTAQAPRAGLFQRAKRANALKADLFLAVHHDAVPDGFLVTWQFNGHEQQYNDVFPGHSLFVSKDNGDPRGSLAFAHLLGMALKGFGLKYTTHYKEKYMGNRQRILVDAQAGVYRYDQLIVLMSTRMPAVLLEAGSIVNRAEELALESPERQMLISSAVVEAVDAFCTARSRKRPPAPVARKH
jgi:N-acetylmuramoyl-L-alanine amidase